MALYQKYNQFLGENGYGEKYGLGNARMFIIEGMDKVREVIEKNRSRKLARHKKMSNNTVIEIDSCSPLEMLRLQAGLSKIAEGEGIAFVAGRVKPKTPRSKLYEGGEGCGKRLMHYKRGVGDIGEGGRRSSKTEVACTFVRE